MVFLPLSDEKQDKTLARPYAVYVILIVTCVVFFWRRAMSGGEADLAFDTRWGVIPSFISGEYELSAFRRFAPLVTYMFLHGGVLHLASNMIFLWIFGDDIEDALGRLRFVVFYLLCGAIAALVHCAMTPHANAPLIGASGAIAGVMGAYLALRPCAKINVLIFIKVVQIRAVWVIALWGLLQIFSIVSQSRDLTAWWAHIGGLLAGLCLYIPLRRPGAPLFDCVRRN